MLNRDVFSKYKPNIKLATRFDSDGKEIQVETREDTEQTEKLQEIIDILVAAGYFRARIKGLSSFDKVIGGMTWCIESCNFDIDVDLLFQENLTIGQKIALTEKIVSVLPLMSCPHVIEPHQIQGLDFIKIFPVIQWLVKRSVESREERAERVRTFAISQFDKLFCLKSDVEQREAALRLENKLKDIIGGPKRQYRFKGPRPEDEVSRVQITLLEYGTQSSSILKIQHEKKDSESESQEQELSVEEDQAEQDLDMLADKMMPNPNPEEEFDFNSEDVAKIAEHYSALRAELSADTTQNAINKQIMLLTQAKQSLENKCKRLENDKEELSEEIEKNSKILEEKIQSRLVKEQEVVDITTEELDDNKKRALDEIQQLVAKIENSRQQETKFKEQCKIELADLQKRIEEMEAQSPEDDTEELRKNLQTEKEKLQTLRLKLAKRTRAVATLQRKLDQIPGRAELAQYQRRFMELYNQVSAKHRETKQFYTLYNTLDDTKLYLSKELSLLNSIFDNYSQTISSNPAKEQFIKQFENIVEGIQATKRKVEARYNDEKSKRDSLNEQLLMLIDQQRRYFLELRNLTKECQRNEALLNQFKSM